ncbi:MAG: 50S ribosomal protein L13 [Chthoniobacterales bacterium]|nr:50S ribosomal protein L13 [Chthoniobacterales bacterium]MCX7712965.1 50S ribosomal protein L13 [Chthoniobacterales bacterium]
MANPRTYFEKPNPQSKRWYVIDAEGQVLGRLAVRIANLLRGKQKPTYTPHIDNGDYVIVVNAEKVRVTGKKATQKSYMSFSGYVGGHKSEAFHVRLNRHPELILERAVRGMLPHNRLGRAIYRKLKVYRGPNHPHEAQKPELINL